MVTSVREKAFALVLALLNMRAIVIVAILLLLGGASAREVPIGDCNLSMDIRPEFKATTFDRTVSNEVISSTTGISYDGSDSFDVIRLF